MRRLTVLATLGSAVKASKGFKAGSWEAMAVDVAVMTIINVMQGIRYYAKMNRLAMELNAAIVGKRVYERLMSATDDKDHVRGVLTADGDIENKKFLAGVLIASMVEEEALSLKNERKRMRSH